MSFSKKAYDIIAIDGFNDKYNLTILVDVYPFSEILLREFDETTNKVIAGNVTNAKIIIIHDETTIAYAASKEITVEDVLKQYLKTIKFTMVSAREIFCQEVYTGEEW